MDCERCGAPLPGTKVIDGDDVWWDGDKVKCECGAVSQITVFDDEDDEDLGRAYVSHWTCKHGSDDKIPCAACDAEDAAVGASP